MKLTRGLIENWYSGTRNQLFKLYEDPEEAYDIFLKAGKVIHKLCLEDFLFDCPENRLNPGFEISNAAGFNKDGSIPPTFLKILGFDRVVVGTVTADLWKGNPRPRMKIYPETKSMVNWTDLPGKGAKIVAMNLESYGHHNVPITINLMSTPRKRGKEVIDDLHETIMLTKYLHGVDRYELNISCPNMHSSSGAADAREEYQNNLASMLSLVNSSIAKQQVYLKVSPDLDMDSIKTIVEIAHQYNVLGLTTTSTAAQHNPKYITSPPNPEGKGEVSGNAVYEHSSRTQIAFRDAIRKAGYNMEIIACGGINSGERALIRTMPEEVTGIQIYTPLIFKGPSLLRELRRIKRRRI